MNLFLGPPRESPPPARSPHCHLEPPRPGLWPYSSARSLTFVSAASEGKQYLWMGTAGSLEHTCLSLADSLVPMEIKPGISLATVSAVLHTKDNKHVLQPPPRPAQPTGGKKRKRASDDIPDCKVLKPLLSGSIPVDQFVQTLEKVEDTAKGHIVLLQEAETLIQIEEDSTHIICDDDEVLRVRLRDLVLKFLQNF
ncbi:INTS9 [Cervus elaphus hippelaphus]|uniref:INTS9 n=1 Tax=Cervus elaphus hippelaphus TaxID=46360 RepID=A0A212C5H2_CEREH|nr:INTS9 [Cervus elaphus hippelaphus]